MIQDKQRYYNWLRRELTQFNAEHSGVRSFVFGSSISEKQFGDVDIGIVGDVSTRDISQLKNRFEQSNFPFFVDIVHFDSAQESFKEVVSNKKIVWMH